MEDGCLDNIRAFKRLQLVCGDGCLDNVRAFKRLQLDHVRTFPLKGLFS